MKIEVYVIDVYYFDGASWDNESLEIKALTLFSLMKCFLRETHVVHYQTQKELWNKFKNRIYKDVVSFPLVTRG